MSVFENRPRPQIKPRNLHMKAHERVLEILIERWPEIFIAKGRGEPKKPLALWIGEEILLALPELSSRLLAQALEEYTFGLSYTAALREGADRYGLDGKPCGKVTAREAQFGAWRQRKLEFQKAASKRAKGADGART